MTNRTLSNKHLVAEQRRTHEQQSCNNTGSDRN